MDPYATEFLKDALGPEKWAVFSARLFERRLSASKPRSRKGKGAVFAPAVSEEECQGRVGGANAVEFLVKVEIVKEVLRTFVP